MRRPLASLVALCLAVAAPAWISAQDGVTTVIVVRHAEKAGPTGDVPLSEAGHRRAALLSRMTDALEVSGLISTPFLRTQQTLTPLSLRTGVDIELVTPGPAGVEAHAEDIVALIKREHRGGVVVVAGHSNTVPAIVNALGAGPAPELTDEDYDDIFLVKVFPDDTAMLLHLKYGMLWRG